jgi:hypothetical protein
MIKICLKCLELDILSKNTRNNEINIEVKGVFVIEIFTPEIIRVKG